MTVIMEVPMHCVYVCVCVCVGVHNLEDSNSACDCVSEPCTRPLIFKKSDVQRCSTFRTCLASN
jgi:hypothetical protein